MRYLSVVNEVEFFVVICCKEVDDEIDEEEEIDDASDYNPVHVVFVSKGESPRGRNADEEDENGDEKVPESLEFVFWQNDEVAVV